MVISATQAEQALGRLREASLYKSPHDAMSGEWPCPNVMASDLKLVLEALDKLIKLQQSTLELVADHSKWVSILKEKSDEA